MVAPVVTSTSVVIHLAVDAVWVGSASGVVASPAAELRDCLDAIDDELVDSGRHVRPTAEVLAAVIGGAAGSVSGQGGFVDSMTVLHPTLWGSARRAVLEKAARRSANDVATVPIALAVPAPTGASGWIVVECAETSISVAAVHRGPQGLPTIAACTLAPRIGTLDLEADSGRISVIERLIEEVSAGESAAAVTVVGTSADAVADLLSASGARDVRVVPAAALVGSDTRIPETDPAAALSEPARTSWVDRLPDPEPSRTTARPTVALAVTLTVVALLVAVGSVIAVRYARESDRSPAAVAALHRVEIGRVSTELPEAWQVRGDRSVRLDLAPDDGRGGRILLLPTELAAGSGRDAVVRGLERKIGERGSAGPFSGFTADVEFGGRHAVGYVESPADGSRVRWFVLVEDGVQVSVGCQYRDVGWEAIAADCEQAVRAVAVAPTR
ncbi:type VII secretion-associated protein [Rhodococcus sp. (in: high G+C Gram-positive bacteria)]|uniref:type VII secretion-associated protein n=1 Tax=Rhodococcus sp. TaxID=1831 RepID=UPI003B8A7B50